MPYVYHAVPYNMKGTTLYPLNELREVDITLYQPHADMYCGRESIMRQRIPLLENCLWNDVLFLTAVHPAQFRQAFTAAGYVRRGLFRAFEFEITSLDHSKMAVITEMHKGGTLIYEPFDPIRLEEYATVPQETTDYWHEQYERGNKRPFLFLHIPHILYRGNLDTATATIVEA